MGLLRWQGRDKIMRTDQTKDGAPSEGTLGSQGQQNQGSRRKLGDGPKTNFVQQRMSD